MSFTDTTNHNPSNFVIQYDNQIYRMFDFHEIFNDDSSTPMQKYLFMIEGIKILSHHKPITTASMSVNDAVNKQIYKFINELETNICAKLDKKCKTNFQKHSTTITMCLYSRTMIIYDDDNIQVKNATLNFGDDVSIIIKLTHVVCDKYVCTPIWNIVQLKLHKNIENTCMFIQSKTPTIIKPPPPPPLPLSLPKFEKKEPLPTKFAPSVGDIVSTLGKLRKTEPKVKCAIPIGNVVTKIKKHHKKK